MHYHIPKPVGKYFAQNCLSALLKYFRNVGLENTPPPPPENENLGRSWHLGFELVWSIPPPPPIKFGQILALGILGFELVWRTTPDLCGSWCVATNCCIPQGYRLVSLLVMSGASMGLNVNVVTSYYSF